MGRIRTIKPEVPHSQSMGRVSREARLFFILSWTLLDDAGRARGNSRLLASLLYPHDTDVSDIIIDGWITELEEVASLIRYEDDEGHQIIAAINWGEHQRIDKPSKSKLPPPPEEKIRELKAKAREKFGRPREHSPLDQGREGTKEGTKERSSVLRTGADAPSEKSLDAKPPPDDRTWCFQPGLQWLVKAAALKSENQARPIMGKWLKAAGDNATLLRAVLEEAVAAMPADPIPWVTKALEYRLKGNGAQSPHPPPVTLELVDPLTKEGRRDFSSRVKAFKRHVDQDGADPYTCWPAKWGGKFPGDHETHVRDIVVEILGEQFLSERDR
jgi:hypothetical protein